MKVMGIHRISLDILPYDITHNVNRLGGRDAVVCNWASV